MPRDYVDVDRFGAELTQILGRLEDSVEDKMPDAVREGAKVGRREWRANAPVRTGAYRKSISYRVKGRGAEVNAEVGSATMPGLVHLLEKGHARVGGGRVAAIPHVAPAADEAFKVTYDEFKKLVSESVEEASR